MILNFDEKDKTLLLLALDLAISKMRQDGVSCHSWRHFESLEAKVRAYDCASAHEAARTYEEVIAMIGDLVEAQEAAHDERQIDLEEAIAAAVQTTSVRDVPTDSYPNGDYPCDVEPKSDYQDDLDFIDAAFAPLVRRRGR